MARGDDTLLQGDPLSDEGDDDEDDFEEELNAYAGEDEEEEEQNEEQTETEHAEQNICEKVSAEPELWASPLLYGNIRSAQDAAALIRAKGVFEADVLYNRQTLKFEVHIREKVSATVEEASR